MLDSLRQLLRALQHFLKLSVLRSSSRAILQLYLCFRRLIVRYLLRNSNPTTSRTGDGPGRANLGKPDELHIASFE